MQDRRHSVRQFTRRSLSAVTALVVGLMAISASLVGLSELASGGLSTSERPTSRPPTRSFDATTTATVSTTPVKPKVREIKVPARDDVPREAAEATTPVPDEPSPATPEPSDGEGESTVVAATEPEDVDGFATVGVTWRPGVRLSPDDVAINVRTRTGGSWSEWTELETDEEDGPDRRSLESSGVQSRPGTGALVVGDVAQVQLRAETIDGQPIPDLRLVVVDPGISEMKREPAAIDTAALSPSTGTSEPERATTSAGSNNDEATLSAMKVAAKPQIFSRAQWGANERLRDSGEPDMGTVQAGFIHHTVNANDYAREDVPALLRGIYAFHTQSRGWSDIAYNFLVDRFGRIWEGRYGGVSKAVVGAHTLGYNEVSFAMSAIGNYETAKPSAATTASYAKLLAWKLSLSNIRADAPRILLKGRYVPAISGHSDVGQTACPGRYLYQQIPLIRRMAQAIQNEAQQGGPSPSPQPTQDPKPNRMSSPTQQPRPSTPQPSSLTFPRSLNLLGDSAPDLLLRRSTGAVDIVQTGGQLSLGQAVSTRGDWGRYTKVAAIGDVTGDGDGDVIGLLPSRLAHIYRGNGTGRVSTTRPLTTRAFDGASAIVPAGDWNGDGKADVVIRDRASGFVWLVRGLGDGQFAPRTLLTRRLVGQVALSVSGDVTGDGRRDIVGLGTDGYLQVVARSSGESVATPVRATYVGNDARLVGVGSRDLSGDGVGDVVIRRGTEQAILVLPGRGNGTFGRALGPLPMASTRQMSVGHMLGGKTPSVLSVSADGSGLLHTPSNGLENVRAIVRTNISGSGITQLLNVGDWDGDGHGDVAVRQGSGDVLALRRGSGTGQFATAVVMATGWQKVKRLTAAGDVTGDKRPDLLGITAAGVVIYPGDGRRGFQAPVMAPRRMTTFNKLGDARWVTRGSSAIISATRSGAFVPSGVAPAPSLAAYKWSAGPGDIDGDGRPDLVVVSEAGLVWLLRGQADGHAKRRLITEGPRDISGLA